MIGKYPKRLIEVDLPIGRISAHARAEKDSRVAPVPRLHIYPAARPLAACRAVLLASMWPDPVDLTAWRERGDAIPISGGNVNVRPAIFLSEASKQMNRWARIGPSKAGAESATFLMKCRKDPLLLDAPHNLRRALLDFIADFADWDHSLDAQYLETARTLTRAAHESLGGSIGTRPLVIDPFAGGGAIPLEAIRVGADSVGSDTNPLAVLINKVVLEYAPQHGERLVEALELWQEWLKGKAKDYLQPYYPSDPDGGVPIVYLWARTILSEAPGDGGPPIEVPLIRSMWLSRKGSLRALRWVRDKNGRVATEVVEVRYADGTERRVRRPLLEVFEPRRGQEIGTGTVARNSATCPVTGYTTPSGSVQAQLGRRMGGAADARLYCVVLTYANTSGRHYRLSDSRDIAAVKAAVGCWFRLVNASKGDMSPLIDEPLPVMSGVFNAPLYGHKTWGSLFTPRQLLALTTYARLAREFVEARYSSQAEFAPAVAAVLGLVVGRLADLNASLCVWQLSTPNTAHVFGRWALPMIMDFGEVNPLAGAGGSPESVVWRAVSAIRDVALGAKNAGAAQMVSATEYPLPDDAADVLFTDPPYYNAVPYADISDFFYVWLRRVCRDWHPSLFATPLTLKDKEICEMAGWDPVRYKHKDKAFFERGMKQALTEARRAVKPWGVGTVVFAHKSTGGWEALLQALIDAGWVITASWPVDTEMASRLRAKNSAVLASSVHLVCRPREKVDSSVRGGEIGNWRDVLQELPERISEWMPRLAREGIVGADAVFACLGPALELFSRYPRVEKASGEAVTLREYLEQVWAAVAKEALGMIFSGADATDFEGDARLTAMWLWTLNAGDGSGGNSQSTEGEEPDDEPEGAAAKARAGGFALEYDAARKIAQGLGAHLEELSNVVEIKGDTARLLPVQERMGYLFGRSTPHAREARHTRKKKPKQGSLFEELEVLEEAAGATQGDAHGAAPGTTVLDRVHQAMILFASGRGTAVKRFLVEDGVGKDPRFWRLADALAALYPRSTDERRWVEGVLARKKGLGF